MTEELIAQAIKGVFERANALLGEAASMGLQVEVKVDKSILVGDRIEHTHVDVRVSKVL